MTKFAGYTSVNSADIVADASACVLVIVIVRSAVPPAPMELEEKLLAIVGRAGVTASISEAEQTPATVHEPETLVFDTVAGGVIETILLTCVCANTESAQKKDKNNTAKSTKKWNALSSCRNSGFERPSTFKGSKKPP